MTNLHRPIEPARLNYCRTFFFLSMSMVAAGVSTSLSAPAASLVPLYTAVSFLTIAVFYRSGATNPFHKRSTGQVPFWSWIACGPYLLLSIICFRLYCPFSRQRAIVEVSRNLYFGRRLTPREARKSDAYGWRGVLDLAAEFSESRQLRVLPGYKSSPIMDATAPTAAQLRDATNWIASVVADGPVYVHCAFGHGRSACIVIGYLLSVGEVNTIDEGVTRLRKLRPGVRLTPEQRAVLSPLERPVDSACSTSVPQAYT